MAGTIFCEKCGAENPDDAEYCAGCGAGVGGAAVYEEREKEAMHHQQAGFSWLWVAIGFGIMLGLQVGVSFLLEAVAPDRAVIYLLAWMAPFLLGGILVGWLSPGKTFQEPAVAALVAMILAFLIAYLRDPELTWNGILGVAVFGAVPGLLLALVGGWIGEKIQGTV
jgi:hypothetical protein